MKSQIIERLGQADILLPALIAEGLAANDRVKVRLSVLQAAARHARDPHGVRFDLATECRTAGMDFVAMQTLVNGASLLAGEQITAPGLGGLGAAICDDVATMTRAVKAADAAKGDAALERLSRLKVAAWPEMTDTIAFAQIARLTGLSDATVDSLHRLVMDLHKALNHLSTACCRRTGPPSKRSCAVSSRRANLNSITPDWRRPQRDRVCASPSRTISERPRRTWSSSRSKPMR